MMGYYAFFKKYEYIFEQRKWMLETLHIFIESWWLVILGWLLKENEGNKLS